MVMIDGTIVLEGGAIRGIFTSGVLDFLMKKDLYFSNVIGVSAGSCNGVDYISRQIERSKNCLAIENRKDYFIHPLKIFSQEGLIDFDKIFVEFPFKTHPFDFDTFFSSSIQMEVGVTDLFSGQAKYLVARNGDKDYLLKSCRASSSVPLLSPIIEIEGNPYLDGGCAASIPIKRALELGKEKNVVVLTRARDYRMKRNKVADIVLKKHYQEYPEFLETLLNRPKRYNETLDYLSKLEEAGDVFVIAPKNRSISNLELARDRIDDFYQHGISVMEENYPKLISYLYS